MINIISLSALREKVTGPGKVVGNLIKGLDILGYPYILNGNLNSCKRLWIHDDISALLHLNTLDKNIKPIIGPNLYSLPRNIGENIILNHIPYIMPCQWIINLWKTFGYNGILDIWPVGIDTDTFSLEGDFKKDTVLVYLKKRSFQEKEEIISILSMKGIKYSYIEYGSYSEQEFKEIIAFTKYVIWIGCPETQGIALEEILSSDVPILIWDVKTLGQWNPLSKQDINAFTEKELEYGPVTSAEYFNSMCGKIVFSIQEISPAIDFMEKNIQKFSPRKFILENLSLAGQARKFLELYNIHYNLSFEQGMNEEIISGKIHSYRNKFLWKNIFRIYDSRFISSIRKLIQ